jgi:FixJ family two-component response regulator
MNAVDLARSRQARPLVHANPAVLVLDGDSSVREALESLIHNAGWAVESFASAYEFLCRPRRLTSGCLILDLNLPQISGLELQKLLADRPEMPLVFTSRHPDIPATVQAMKAGAVEFLTKPLDDQLVLSAVRQAISRSQAALERQAEVQGLTNRFATLSRRERQVMRLVSAGLLNKQVGAELGITEDTVKAHRGQVMRKMQARSLAQLIRLVVQLQLTGDQAELIPT